MEGGPGYRQQQLARRPTPQWLGQLERAAQQALHNQDVLPHQPVHQYVFASVVLVAQQHLSVGSHPSLCGWSGDERSSTNMARILGSSAQNHGRKVGGAWCASM